MKKNLFFTLSIFFLTAQYGIAMEEREEKGSASEPRAKRQKLCESRDEGIKNWNYGQIADWESFFSRPENAALNNETVKRMKKRIKTGATALEVDFEEKTFEIAIDMQKGKENLWREAFALYFTLVKNANERIVLSKACKSKYYPENSELVGHIFGLLYTLYVRCDDCKRLDDAVSHEQPLYKQITEGYVNKKNERRPGFKDIIANLKLTLCIHQPQTISAWTLSLRNFHGYKAVKTITDTELKIMEKSQTAMRDEDEEIEEDEEFVYSCQEGS